MDLEKARKLANDKDNETYDIKQNNLFEVDKVDAEIIDIMENVKYNVIKKKFKKELSEE